MTLDSVETKENVVISAGSCSLALLPEFGGKIASIRVDGHELLQAPLKPLAPRTPNMAFSDADASGWDECLPSVAACTVSTEFGPASIPDHGDLWRIPWRVLDFSPDSATLQATCFSLPLELTRTLLLSETATGWRLRLLYSLANLGGYPVPWSWSAHPLFAVDPGDRLILPNSIQTLRLEGSSNNRLGVQGDSVSWPIAKTSFGGQSDLSLAQDPSAGTGDKLFTDTLRTSAGHCTLLRPTAGLRITLRFETDLTPYLGLWLCYGGWPGGPGPQQVSIAPEPTTAPVDSLERQGPWTRFLDPGETFTWPVELEIDRIPPNSPNLAEEQPA